MNTLSNLPRPNPSAMRPRSCARHRAVGRTLVNVLIGFALVNPLSNLFAARSVVAERIGSPSTLSDPVAGTRWALLVGIGQYPRSEGYEIAHLQGPSKDVVNLRDFLTHPEKGLFPPKNVSILVDEQATLENIVLELERIRRSAGPEDLVIFYFSGHGYAAGTRASASSDVFLIPYFTNPRALEIPHVSCVSFDTLEATIRAMRAKKIVLLLDACHAGGVQPKGSRGSTGNVYERFATAFTEAEGIAMLLSSNASQQSFDDTDGGVFTKFVLRGLEGEADEDENHVITFSELSRFVDRAVPKYVQERFGKEQRPTRRETMKSGDIPLAVHYGKFRALVQREAELLASRVASIYRARSEGMSGELAEYCVAAVSSVHDRAIDTETKSQTEVFLLELIDRYDRNGITAQEFSLRVEGLRLLGDAPPSGTTNARERTFLLQPTNSQLFGYRLLLTAEVDYFLGGSGEAMSHLLRGGSLSGSAFLGKRLAFGIKGGIFSSDRQGYADPPLHAMATWYPLQVDPVRPIVYAAFGRASASKDTRAELKVGAELLRDGRAGVRLLLGYLRLEDGEWSGSGFGATVGVSYRPW